MHVCWSSICGIRSPASKKGIWCLRSRQKGALFFFFFSSLQAQIRSPPSLLPSVFQRKITFSSCLLIEQRINPSHKNRQAGKEIQWRAGRSNTKILGFSTENKNVKECDFNERCIQDRSWHGDPLADQEDQKTWPNSETSFTLKWTAAYGIYNSSDKEKNLKH